MSCNSSKEQGKEMILAHQSWEQTYGLLFQDSGVKSYSLVEITLNQHLFHIRALTKKTNREKTRVWSRYIFAEIADVIRIINEGAFEEVMISVQVSKDKNNDEGYEILNVLKIYEASNEQGDREIIYECCNGGKYYGLFWAADNEQFEIEKVFYEYSKR